MSLANDLHRTAALLARQTKLLLGLILAGLAATVAGVLVGHVVFLFSIPGIAIFYLLFFPITIPAGLLFGVMVAAPTTLVLLPLCALAAPKRLGIRTLVLVAAGSAGGFVTAWVTPSHSPGINALSAACLLAGPFAGGVFALVMREFEL